MREWGTVSPHGNSEQLNNMPDLRHDISSVADRSMEMDILYVEAGTVVLSYGQEKFRV